MDVPRPLYDQRAGWYSVFIALVGHRRSMRKFFAHFALLRPNQKVLDAGCGSGVLLQALDHASRKRGLNLRLFGFDVSNAMLDRAKKRLINAGPVRLAIADTYKLEHELPPDWQNFDLIVSSGMLEYITPAELPGRLAALKKLQVPGAMLVLFITRTTAFNRNIIGRLWRAHTYTRRQLEEIYQNANLPIISIEPFRTWGFVVIA